ncbi:hypothetical protein MXD61_02795 [Frankia sp. AgPm24]|uniref:hypothetical protein n=1 Tax=Frankia sp. AgPm24 TaxID=631128 RepID=UPI00200EA45C|nr:hypothetical protein [Frankia sp. AgPm24]MCK9920843.1 hypothetical protein [Frankia sp. AgPm24]
MSRGSVESVRRLFFAPSWIARHLLALALVALFIRMGIWQFTKGESAQGTMQNLFYGVEWPVFAVFVVYWWFRMIKEALSPPDLEGPQWGVGGRIAPETPHQLGAGGPRMLTAGGSLVADDEDEEVAAYNRYLAALYNRDAQQDALRAITASQPTKQLDPAARTTTPPQINGARG